METSASILRARVLLVHSQVYNYNLFQIPLKSYKPSQTLSPAGFVKPSLFLPMTNKIFIYSSLF